jgi:hypothetical protein
VPLADNRPRCPRVLRFVTSTTFHPADRTSGQRAAAIGLQLAAALFVVCATAYAWGTPFGQAPDERSHFAYVQLIAQHLQLPVTTAERQQPPLYYLIGAALYKLTGSIGVLQGLSIVCGAATVLVIGLCARELWPSHPNRWVLAALLAAALPQFQFISASVSNDAISVLAAAVVTLLMIRIVVRPPDVRLPWAIGIGFGAVLLAKETVYFLLVVTVVMLIKFWPRRHWMPALLPIIALPTLLAGWWFLRNLTTFGSLLPPLTPLYTDSPLKLTDLSLAHDWWSLTFRSFFAVFGNMSTQVEPDGNQLVYRLLQAGTVLIVVAGLMAAALRWRSWSTRARWVAAACVAVPLIALIQMAVSSISVDYQAQGRYLFVAVPLLALGTVFAVSAMAGRLPRWGGAGAGTVLLMTSLALDGLGLYTTWFNLVLT